MSRTVAHQPAWVRLADPALRVAVHDHRDGRCDLPDPGVRPVHRTRCRWRLDTHAAGPTCGCALCADAPWRRAQRRRDRHRARVALRHGNWDLL